LRIQHPKTKIPNEVFHVLEENDFWVHEHTRAEASRPWPKLGSSALAVMELLQSFGSVYIYIITTNIENITTEFSPLLALLQLLGINSITFYVAVGRRYGNLLDIQTEDNTYPKWLSFGVEELAATIHQIQEDD
jgi:hypothetical protein